MASAPAVKLLNNAMRSLWPQRALLEAIIRDNIEQGYGEILPLPGFIRSEVVLGTTNNIQFEIQEGTPNNGQAQIPVENRLRQNDAFYPTHMSVMFYTFTTAGGNDARGSARLQTFPNTNVFTTNAPSVAAAYNGSLNVRINDTVVIDSLDMARFLNAQTAQQGQAVSTVAGTGVTDESAWSQNDMFALTTDPLIRLNGMFNNRFGVKLPGNYNFDQVANVDTVAVLYLRGWLMQNGGGTR